MRDELKKAILHEWAAQTGAQAELDDRLLDLMLDLLLEVIRGGCFDAFRRKPQILHLFGYGHFELFMEIVSVILAEKLEPLFAAALRVRSKASDDDLRRFVAEAEHLSEP